MKHMTNNTFQRFLLFCVLWLGLLGSCGALRAEDSAQEYQLKAAFLVNFARFITWPESSFSSEPQELIFCVVGKNPFGSALLAAEAKKINGRKPKVVYVDSLQKVPACHLLFIGKSENTEVAASMLERFGKQAVVTVSDMPGFANAGGSIEFVLKENRLSFIINHSAMKQQGVQTSASLLNLAASVQ